MSIDALRAKLEMANVTALLGRQTLMLAILWSADRRYNWE